MSVKGLKAKLASATDPGQRAKLATRIDYVKDHYGRGAGSPGAGGPSPTPQPQRPPQMSMPRPISPNGMPMPDRSPQPMGPATNGMRILPNWGDPNMDPGMLSDLVGRFAPQQPMNPGSQLIDRLNTADSKRGPMVQRSPMQSGINSIYDQLNVRENAREGAGAMANALDGNMQPMPRGGQGWGNMPQPQVAGPLMIPRRR